MVPVLAVQRRPTVRFSVARPAGTGRLRRFGGCDPAGVQGCSSHDESLVLVYSTAQRSTEQGSHESRTAEPASTTLSMTLKAFRSRYRVQSASSRRIMHAHRGHRASNEERRAEKTRATAARRWRPAKKPLRFNCSCMSQFGRGCVKTQCCFSFRVLLHFRSEK